MKKKWMLNCAVWASLLCMTPALWADDFDYGLDFDFNDDSDLLGSDFNFGIDGVVNLGAMVNRDGQFSGTMQKSFVQLSLEWRQRVRAVITARLDHLFDENNVHFTDDFSIGEFIQDAYIEIREVAGSPVAIVVGRQHIPFAQGVEAMPFYKNNPLYELQDIEGVYGFTVNLTQGLFGLFDQAEVSVFESEGGSFKLGRIDGMSLRLSRMITEHWLLTLSHARLGNNHLGDDARETRTSIGLIGETRDGVIVGWAEGMIITNNPEYVETNLGLTAGVMMNVYRATDVIVEYSWLQKELQEIALGVSTNLSKRVTLGAEIRYRHNFSQRNDVITGVILTFVFGNSPYSHNYDYLFGRDDDDDDYFEGYFY